MYNRYIPQPDGTYQRKRVENPTENLTGLHRHPLRRIPVRRRSRNRLPPVPRRRSPGRVKRPQAFCSSCFPGILTQGI